MPAADLFLAAEPIRASTFIRHIEIHESLDSTNDRAAEMAADQNIELPALFVARRQTAGRGRGQNAWWSADGALTFSVLLDPSSLGITTANWPQLSLATAVAVCDALDAESTQDGGRNETELAAPSPQPPAPCSIKWPNDVMFASRKVGGILIESPGGSAPAKDRLIIGIGINVNNSWSNAPPEMSALGTALCDNTGRVHDLQLMLSNVLIALAHRIEELQSGGDSLRKAWQQLDWLRGQMVVVELNGRSCTGRCQAIDDDGALVVETTEGVRRFHSGSVRSLY